MNSTSLDIGASMVDFSAPRHPKYTDNPLNPAPDKSPMNRDRRDVPLVRGT